jgi:hypothetical protein
VRRAETDLATRRAHRPVTLTAEETRWISRAGAEIATDSRVTSTRLGGRAHRPAPGRPSR